MGRHFSSCGERGLPTSCCVSVSHCGSSSRWGAQALGHVDSSSWNTWASVVEASGLPSTGSVVVAYGFSYCTACGIFPDQGSNPCLWPWHLAYLPLSHQGSPPTCTVEGDTALGNILGFSPYLLQVINPSFCSWAWLCLLAPHPRGKPYFLVKPLWFLDWLHSCVPHKQIFLLLALFLSWILIRSSTFESYQLRVNPGHSKCFIIYR